MEVHDIRVALSSVPELTMTSRTTEEEADAAFPILTLFNQGGVFVGRFSGQTPWERHSAGDELLHVLDGAVDITVLTEGGLVDATVHAGCIFVVPRGLWHRQVARPVATLLSATPQPTEISVAEHPKRKDRH